MTTVQSLETCPVSIQSLKPAARASSANIFTVSSESSAKSMPANGSTGTEGWMAKWRCVSLALYEYRRGNYPGSMDWCNRCLAYGTDCPARLATIHLLLAMSHLRLDQTELAHAELAQGRELIDHQFKAGLVAGDGDKGFWFDWVLGRILEREASADQAKSQNNSK